MSESSDYTWYIDPCGDDRTNECIGKMFVEMGVEGECWSQLCEDGCHRNLWSCPNYEFVANSEIHFKRLKYRHAIYKKNGKYGQIRLWVFSSAQFPKLVTKKKVEQNKAH